MIINYIKRGKVVFPDPDKHKIFMSKDMRDFISGLLDKDPDKRLGSRGKDEVLNHPWFDGLKWDSLLKKKIIPPYYPETS